MNVPVGWATRIGGGVTAFLAALTAAAVFLPDLQQKLVDAGVPPGMVAKGVLILGVVIAAGRYLQAALGVMGRESGPGTVVATTGSGDVQVPTSAPDGGTMRDGEHLVDPPPTAPSDVPLGDATR